MNVSQTEPTTHRSLLAEWLFMGSSGARGLRESSLIARMAVEKGLRGVLDQERAGRESLLVDCISAIVQAQAADSICGVEQRDFHRFGVAGVTDPAVAIGDNDAA